MGWGQVAQVALGGLNTLAQQWGVDQANRDREEQYRLVNQLIPEYGGALLGNQRNAYFGGGGLPGVLPEAGRTGVELYNQYGTNTGNLEGRYGTNTLALQGSYDTGAAGINRMAGNRLATGMGMVENLGGQELRDIDRRFTNLANAGEQDLVSRGLRNTGVATGARIGAEREKVEALGGARDRINAAKLNTYGTLSGDVLGTKTALFSGGQNLRQGRTAGQENLQYGRTTGQEDLYGNLRTGMLDLGQNLYGNLYNAATDWAGRKLNWEAGQTYQAPDEASYQNAMSNAGASLARRR